MGSHGKERGNEMAEISDEQLREAYRGYCAHRESEARYRRMEVMMSVTLGCIVVAFVAASYFTVRANYSDEQLSARLNSEISALAPEISNALFEVGEQVMPTYVEMGEKKLREALPQVELALNKELEKLWAGVTEQVETDFNASLDRSAKKLEERLREEFPELLDEPGLALLETEINEMLEKDTGEFLNSFFDRYSQDLNKLYKMIDGFHPNRFERLSDEELAAQYVHLWLTLLDREILGLD